MTELKLRTDASHLSGDSPEAETAPALSLTMEIVPKPLHGVNLRRSVGPKRWDVIRKQAYEDAGHQCEICGEKHGGLECHERWEYDDVNHIQTLRGFIVLCSNCHHIKHPGMSNILAAEGKLDLKTIQRHFMKVNNVGWDEYSSHYDYSFAVYRERSTHEWTQDLSILSGITG